MNINKAEILKNICYTDRVYERINKKLETDLSREQIEELVFKTLNETDEKFIIREGKNFYAVNNGKNIMLTINSNTFRIITADKIKKT